MSNDLKNAVSSIKDAIVDLEKSMSHAQKKLSGTQRDMFGNRPDGNKNVDKEGAIASIDRAISGLESLLDEDKGK